MDDLFNTSNFTNNTNDFNNSLISASNNNFNKNTITNILIFDIIIIGIIIIFIAYNLFNQPSEYDDIISEYKQNDNLESRINRQKSEECIIICEQKNIIKD